MKTLPTLLLASVLCFAQGYKIGESTAKPNVSLITLEDAGHGVIAGIAPEKGGQMATLKIRRNGEWIELLYRAADYTVAPPEFAGKAPLLFPATGRSFTEAARREMARSGQGRDGGSWIWQGKEYPMPIHGFARDLPWKVERKSAEADGATLVLTLEDSAETRKYYPFGFHLSAIYRLSGGSLDLTYLVRASETNQAAMPFSIGNHIAFNAPLVPGSDPKAVRLETPATVEVIKDRFSVPSGERREWKAPATIGELPVKAAISLTGYSTGEPYLEMTDPAGLRLRLSHEASEAPPQPVLLFNLWGDPQGGFFSPEPWVGLQNSLNLKQGLVHLEPGKIFRWHIRLEPEWTRQ